MTALGHLASVLQRLHPGSGGAEEPLPVYVGEVVRVALYYHPHNTHHAHHY